MKRRILIAEDSSQTREQLRTLLEAVDSFVVDTTEDGKSALEALTKNNYSIFLTDLKMPQVDGMKLIEEIRKMRLAVTVIVMTGFGSIDKAVQAMRLGAYDFLPKPIDIDHLRLVIDRALRERSLQDEVAHLREQLGREFSFHDLLSKNPAMQKVFELIQHVAATTTTVVVEGETGTGKELVARAIHEASSPHRSGPLVAINCAALPENLLESELFGHEKGAFTTAVSQRKGRFEMAEGGTLFLDEVGDIPASMQVKLLRVLQDRRFERVGGTTTIEADVRVVAATNRNLERLVKKGKFREDLFYRLNVVKIDLPPLRERLEDVPLLATHFAAQFARPGEPPKPFSPAAMETLLSYSWPGNIRELENAVERACVTARGPTLEREDLPPEILEPRKSSKISALDLNKPLTELLKEVTEGIEKQYLLHALKKCHGNIGRCARQCGLSRRSISSKLHEYQIDKNLYKEK
jgi:two-component system, NtrC family, response regulator AtoC